MSCLLRRALFIALGSFFISACESFPGEVDELQRAVQRSYERLESACESGEKLASSCESVFRELEPSLENAASGALKARAESRTELQSRFNEELDGLEGRFESCHSEILDHQVQRIELALKEPEAIEDAESRVAAGQREPRSSDRMEQAAWLLLRMDRDLDRANKFSSRVRGLPAELRVQRDAIIDLKRSLDAIDALDERARVLREMSAEDRADMKNERALAVEEARAAKARYEEASRIVDELLFDQSRVSTLVKSE
jgi:hypothetical protein